ncbi:hypothetical protein HYY75_10465 [bacterium]|nr:hypothetical protein [bacterium]
MEPKCLPVYITGIGAVTPVATGVDKMFDALCKGENGIREIPEWKKAGFPVSTGGLVQDRHIFEQEQEIYDFYKSRKAVFAVTALREAFEKAGGAEAFRCDRGGIFLGVETGRIDIQKLFRMFLQSGTPTCLDSRKFGISSFHYLTPGESLSKQPFFIPSLLGRVFGISGEARSISNACSSANQAIGEAFRKIASGALDWAIVGGSDDMVDEYMAIGFHLLGALATGMPADSLSRPFDSKRRGFVLGESTLLFSKSL